jgi:2-polyprenyl-3-methyl-5-hydroxy-6-metoxy-1,4-benzoquinol methylase
VGWFDPAVEYELRKLFYRTTYYEARQGEPESMASGWSDAASQCDAYREFLPHLTNDGNVLDLGCGDGRLLAFLHQHASVRVIPHGVDFLEESIAAAQQNVLPQFAENFVVANVAEFDPGSTRFAHVIVNPFYVAESSRDVYLRRCFEWVEPGGSLLIYEYAGASGFDLLPIVCRNAGLSSCTLYRSSRVALVCCVH